MKFTVDFDIENGVIKGMLLRSPRMTEKEYKEQLTETARLWKAFGDFLDFDLIAKKKAEML